MAHGCRRGTASSLLAQQLQNSLLVTLELFSDRIDIYLVQLLAGSVAVRTLAVRKIN